jgi:hypothetical protein
MKNTDIESVLNTISGKIDELLSSSTKAAELSVDDIDISEKNNTDDQFDFIQAFDLLQQDIRELRNTIKKTVPALIVADDNENIDPSLVSNLSAKVDVVMQSLDSNDALLDTLGYKIEELISSVEDNKDKASNENIEEILKSVNNNWLSDIKNYLDDSNINSMLKAINEKLDILATADDSELLEDISYTLNDVDSAIVPAVKNLSESDKKITSMLETLNEKINSVMSDNGGTASDSNIDDIKALILEQKEYINKLEPSQGIDTFKKFLAESTIAEQKALLQKGVTSNRRELSYTLADLASSSNTLILDMVKTLGFKDSKNIKKLGEIRGEIYRYINNSASNPQLKQKIADDILSFRQEIETCLQNKSLTNEQAVNLFSKIEELQSGFNNFEEGKIQQLLTIYKKILPKGEYEKVAESYEDTIKSLDKSIGIETEDFLSKLRDIRLGSAPTDILTILGSFAVLGYNLGKSKDNDQRQSIALKYGFPALAGIGVSLFCNAKLYAGSKSLLFGGISTWLLNRIGEWGDNKLKAYKAQKSQAA